jgi:hypothetical protein
MRRAVPALASVLVVACSATGGGGASAPPAAPTAAEGSAGSMQIMGQGRLQPVDGSASGLAELVVQPDGSYEVVLEDFSIPSIEHTNVVLVPNESVGATGDIDKSMLLDLGPLVSTSGMQSFTVPPDMAADVMQAYGSVVIWDTEMAHAIAAASLQ